MCDDACCASFELVNRVKESAKDRSLLLTSEHWDAIHKHNFDTNGQIEFEIRRVKDFLRILYPIYESEPQILKTANSDNMFGFGLGKTDKDFIPFPNFCDAYLRLLFDKVIRTNLKFPNCDFNLLRELRQAARAVKSHEKFETFWFWQHVQNVDVNMRNSRLKELIPPIRHIFHNTTKVRRQYIMETSGASGEIGKCVDLLSCPEEVLNVTAFPVELKTKMEYDNFGPLVTKILTHVRKKSITWLSSKYLSDVLHVDLREFEEWADKTADLISRPGRAEGVTFYTLKPLSEREKAMTKSPEHTPECICAECMKKKATNSHPATCPCTQCKAATPAPADAPIKPEELPEIGTDEFDTHITQFLSEDDENVWRSSDAVSQLGYDADKFHEWALKNPAITIRLSAKSTDDAPKRLYALHARLEPIKKVDDKKAAEEAVAATKEKEKKDEKKKPAGSSITMQELLAFGMIHRATDDFIRIMNFYANGLATRHEEAFAHLTKVQKHMSAAVALMQKSLKVSDKKLPSLEDI